MLIAWLVLAASLVAQSTATVRIHVQHESMPVAGAEVVVNDKTFTTSAAGDVTVSVSPGAVTITVVKEGFEPLTSSVTRRGRVRRSRCSSTCGRGSRSRRR